MTHVPSLPPRMPLEGYEARGAWVRHADLHFNQHSTRISTPDYQHFWRCDGAQSHRFVEVSTPSLSPAAPVSSAAQSAITCSAGQSKLDGTERSTDVDGGFPFFRLPLELRKHIYSRLVQTGCTFVFAPWHNGRATIRDYKATVTKITPPMTPAHDRIASLFCTSRRVREECYSMLFGENTFFFREVTTSINETIFTTTQLDHMELWTKVFRGVKTYCMWPMTSTTVPFLKTVKCMIITLDGPHSDDYRRLQKRVDRAVSNLAQCLDLRVLHVTLSRYRANELVRHHRYAPRMVTREASHDVALSITSSGRISVQAADCGLDWVSPPERKQYLLEPLVQLYGMKEVKIDGLVDPEFSARLCAVMMNETRMEVPVSPASGAKKMVARKMPGRTKKKVVEQAVLRYWEPRYNWEAIGECDEMVS